MTSLKKNIRTVIRGEVYDKADSIAVEEPLQIFLRSEDQSKRESISYSITMRTPGLDSDLVMGLLYSEQIIRRAEDVVEMEIRGPLAQVAHVSLKKTVDLQKLKNDRSQLQSSACGVCGKTSLDFLEREGSFYHRPNAPRVLSSLFNRMLRVLDSQDGLFQLTGGIHAASLFTTDGDLIQICEDVGRHNAMDKLVGWTLKNQLIPLNNHVVLFSGRTSFELMQKAHEAGISIVASVGAPSSLAIDMADEHGITLVGFLKPNQFNVYSDHNRIDYVEEKVG